MSIEDNRTAVRKLCAMLDSHDLDDLSEVMEEDFVEQVPAPGQGPGLEGFRRYMEYMYTAFPDLRWHVVDQVAEGDRSPLCTSGRERTAVRTRGSTPPTSTFVWPR